jgi:hypothetical protein
MGGGQVGGIGFEGMAGTRDVGGLGMPGRGEK